VWLVQVHALSGLRVNRGLGLVGFGVGGSGWSTRYSIAHEAQVCCDSGVPGARHRLQSLAKLLILFEQFHDQSPQAGIF
jgi:hypothetical protein